MTPHRRSPTNCWTDLEARLGTDDIVLLEGLYRPGIPVIEVEDAARQKALKFRAGKPGGRGQHGEGPPGLPCFHPDQIAAICAFMEEYHGK